MVELQLAAAEKSSSPRLLSAHPREEGVHAVHGQSSAPRGLLFFMEWATGAQLMGRAHVMRILRVLIYLDTIITVKTIPPECDLPNILRREKEHCFEMLSNDKIGSGMQKFQAGCDGLWDNVTCWPSSSLGKTIAVPCPKVIYVLTHKEGFVYRNCTSEGWSEAFPLYGTACGYDVNDTSKIVKRAYYMNVKIMYTMGYSTSFISLSIAIAILGLFRKLHCTRNYIHMHLFVSYILRAISIFIKDSVLFSSEDLQHCNSYSVECKVVIVFFQYCNMANFSWLLVEALYLYTALVVSVFSERKYFWRYIVLGWGAPAIFIISWSIARQIYENIGCWDVNSDEQIWWIIKGPVIVSNFINFFLFIRIIGILIKNLKTPDAVRNDLSQYRRLAKSTLLLIPLFGIHYIVFAIFPDKESNLAMDLHIGFDVALGSFQGFVVAVLYCFLNGEVRAEIKKKWRQRKGNQHNPMISNW
ncbi:secretin receptor isoform X1 [Carcharodon carcharias]|uniref:secretin receptor isoform X1 n=2 Tax=Carcharodon carcharias TaxID=13397 RepID=UPI001B7F77ED|nr:secretin receptor isoform X1 [Carcharodon carcharias]